MTTIADISEAGPAVRELLADYSIEATPGQIAKIDDFSALMPAGSSVYVPFLPGTSFVETADACAKVAAQGMRPIPHLPARGIENTMHLAGWLARFQASGADSLLLIAGDIPEPRGEFDDTMQVLDTGLLEEYGFRRIAVAGHPEGHPVAGEAELARALAHKAAYARRTGSEMWLVTQFVFDADPVVAWLRRLRESGVDLPVRVGLPGPAKLHTLLGHAVKCGVAASARMLRRRPDMANMLLGRWYPDQVLYALAQHRRADRNSLLTGVHVFPFGGVQRAAEWFGSIRDGRMDISAPAAEEPRRDAAR